MRFLVVSHFYAAHGGGVERVAGQMCQHIAAQGHKVTWAASTGDEPGDAACVDIIPLPCVNPTETLTGLPMPIPGPRALRRLWCNVRIADVVVVHDALYVTSIAAMLIAQIQRKPVIMIQHVAQIAFANRFMRALMALANHLITRPMLRRADQVIFISETVRRYFCQLNFKRPPLLQFNGVDTAMFYPGPPRRHEFNLPENGLMVAFVGRFVEKKGLGILHALARRCPDVHFAMAGTGPLDPRHWNLKNVHILGPLMPARVAELFRSADFLALPSVGEGYPLVIQEAMATGLPVICGEESALADPGASQWLIGIPVDLADPEEGASHIAWELDRIRNQRTAHSVEDRDAMVGHAQALYSWAGFASRTVAVGKSLLMQHA